MVRLTDCIKMAVDVDGTVKSQIKPNKVNAK